MKEINLCNSNLTTTVDDEDFKFYSNFKWYLSKDGYVIHGSKNEYFKSYEKMHRSLVGAKKSEITDHKDRNKLNNTKDNLRIVTSSQNRHNGVKSTNTINNYKGVYYKKSSNLWQSRCRMNGNDYYLGLFSSEIAAAYAYNVKAASISKYCLLNNLNEYNISYLEHILISHRKKVKVHKGSKYKYIGFRKRVGRMKCDKYCIQFAINCTKYHKGYFFTEDEAMVYLKDNYSHLLNDIGSLK